MADTLIHVWAFSGDRVLSTVCARAYLSVLAAQYNGVYQTVNVRELPNGVVHVLRWKGTYA